MNKKFFGNTFTIIDGPSRDLLFDCLKYAFDKNQRVLATFKTKDDKTGAEEILSCRLLSIEHESGDLDSFNLKGMYFNPAQREWKKFESFYSSRHRNGWFGTVMDWSM